MDELDDLSKLADLRDRGILTEQEFETKKMQILSYTKTEEPAQQPTIKSNNHNIPHVPKNSFLKDVKKIIIISVVSFFIIGFIGAALTDDKKNEKNENNAKLVKKAPKTKEQIKADGIKEIDSQIEKAKLEFDRPLISIIDINRNIENFKKYSTIYDSYANNEDSDIKKKAEEFKSLISKNQVKLFPKMRKIYVDEVKEKMWRANIDVISIGADIKTIQFTGTTLASNANKEDMQNAMKEMITNLRFKRINMKWYQYDDEYTYFTYDTKKDSELY